MAIQSIGEYPIIMKDKVENFHGNQLVFIIWHAHRVVCSPRAFPLPPEMPFGALLTVLPLEIIIEKLTAGRKLFLQKENRIEVNHPANISLFSTEGTYVFSKENILSKSKNAAFLGTEMKGKVYGIYNNNKLVLA